MRLVPRVVEGTREGWARARRSARAWRPTAAAHWRPLRPAPSQSRLPGHHQLAGSEGIPLSLFLSKKVCPEATTFLPLDKFKSQIF